LKVQVALNEKSGADAFIEEKYREEQGMLLMKLKHGLNAGN
jgi:hypothetical protein